MTAYEYFQENLSGEPLTEESVIEVMEEFVKLHLDEFADDIEFEVMDAVAATYKRYLKNNL